MKNARRVLAGLVLAGLSLGAVAVVSADDGGDEQHDAKCRWVRRIGLVCDTELSTVNI